MNAIVDHSPLSSRVHAGRLQKLARLPVFFALQGKRVLIGGASAAAAWKAELLSATGASVEVYAADPSEELRAVAANPPNGQVTLYARACTPADFTGAALAIGACDSEQEAAHFAQAARAAGVPVNVIDKPEFCDFAFGSIVNRSPLVIGISTDGAAPVFAQAIRGKLEALIPAGFANWAEAARRWRPAVKSSGLSFELRRRFWQLFTARAMAQPAEMPAQSQYRTFLAEAAEGASRADGSITLIQIGAEADLMTLRGARALQAADVVMFDDAVTSEILDFARREAKKVAVQEAALRNAEANVWALIESYARDGRRVAYLRQSLASFEDCERKIAAWRATGIEVRTVPAALPS
jgi:uroporphyrin-III C-methyltransferase/precorrin-2 dehydrogenase/sirohydrochlorin ferrochelatase